MNFDHIPSQAELAEVYRQSKKADPTSMEYERILIRPRLHLIRAGILCLGIAAACALIAYAAYMLSNNVLCACLVGIAALLLSAIILAKPILIWLVKAYQRFAPDKTRNRCRYEPSCSQYMILCLEKYGVRRGLPKGIKRWRSCKPPNGGIDLP